MAAEGQAWNLFGFDVRSIGYYFRSGWRDFLWGEASPVLAAVDEVVRARLRELAAAEAEILRQPCSIVRLHT